MSTKESRPLAFSRSWSFRKMARGVVFATVAFLAFTGPLSCPGAEGAAGLSATNKPDEGNSQEMRNYLQLQEQLHATQLAVERARKESTETAVATGEALAARMTARMTAIEQSLGSH